MEKRFVNLSIVTPEGKAFEGDALMVVAPSTDGEVGILHLHAPLICSLTYGPLRVKTGGNEEQVFAVSNGYMEVSLDSVSVIVGTAEPAHAIDVSRAEAARRRAEQKLVEIDKKDKKLYETINSDLQRALNRIKVGNKYRQ